jgi:hypothetical protein
MKMIVESMMECRLAAETEVLGENLPRRHFCPSTRDLNLPVKIIWRNIYRCANKIYVNKYASHSYVTFHNNLYHVFFIAKNISSVQFPNCRTSSPCVIIDFRRSRWSIIDINSVLELLHRLGIVDVVDVSEVHAASIFMVEVCRSVIPCMHMYWKGFSRKL